MQTQLTYTLPEVSAAQRQYSSIFAAPDAELAIGQSRSEIELPTTLSPTTVANEDLKQAFPMEFLPELVKNMFNGMIRLFDHMANFFIGKGGQVFQGQSLPVAQNTENSMPTNGSNPTESDSSQGFLRKLGNAFYTAEKLWNTAKDIYGDMKSGTGNLLTKGAEIITPYVERIPFVGSYLGSYLQGSQ